LAGWQALTALAAPFVNHDNSDDHRSRPKLIVDLYQCIDDDRLSL
jgi:hypothetical protein